MHLTRAVLGFAVLVTTSAAVAACADGRRASPTAPSQVVAASTCYLDNVSVDPDNADIYTGTTLRYRADAWGLSGGNFCTFPSPGPTITWTLSSSLATKVWESQTQPTEYADITAGSSAGTLKVIVTAAYGGRTRADTTNLTIHQITPAPTVGAISGPTSVTASGTYNYSVTAGGGNGSSYSFEWQRSQDGGATWASVHSSSGGATATAPISLTGGNLYSLRVRVRSGNSAWTFSPVLTVDARGAAAPLGVSVDGGDNIRLPGTYTWEAMPTGGSGAYTYYWTLERPDGSRVHGTNKTFSWQFDPCEGYQNYFLEVTVTSGTQTALGTVPLNVELYCD